MPRTKREDPLESYRRTTLWLKAPNGPRLELDVWHPPGILDRERVALLARHASQGVRVLRQLTGTTDIIVQGQYKDEPEE